MAEYLLTKAQIKALSPSNRNDGMMLASRNTAGEPILYSCNLNSTAKADDDNVLMPNDNPTACRWHLFKAMNDAPDLHGELTCTTNGVLGGKGYRFYSPHPNFRIKIEVGFGVSITAGTKSIQLHRWNQAPNASMIGRNWVANLSATGGSAGLTIDSTYQWISISAKNPAMSNIFDSARIDLKGRTILILGF